MDHDKVTPTLYDHSFYHFSEPGMMFQRAPKFNGGKKGEIFLVLATEVLPANHKGFPNVTIPSLVLYDTGIITTGGQVLFKEIWDRLL